MVKDQLYGQILIDLSRDKGQSPYQLLLNVETSREHSLKILSKYVRKLFGRLVSTNRMKGV